jgi:hypothetical protein
MSAPGFCECGAPVPPGGRFCENCGRPLASAPPAPPAMPPSAVGLAHPPGLPPPAGFAPPRRHLRAWVGALLLILVLAVAAVCSIPWSSSPTRSSLPIRSASPTQSAPPASTSERPAAALQNACDAKDCQAATALLHPVVRASYGKILKDHEAELPRLGKLLATRKLLVANADVAEYEVTEDGRTFIVTFERQGDQWFLAGL